MWGYQLFGLPTTQFNPTDAISKAHFDSQLLNYVLKWGSTMTGNLIMGANKITTSALTFSSNELIWKAYADATYTGGGPTYTAGDGIDITTNIISIKTDATANPFWGLENIAFNTGKVYIKNIFNTDFYNDASLANNVVLYDSGGSCQFQQIAPANIAGFSQGYVLGCWDVSTLVDFIKLKNIHIDTAAAITYNKLQLNLSIVNNDISGSAAIAYSKLNLTNSLKLYDFGQGLSSVDETEVSAVTINYLKRTFVSWTATKRFSIGLVNGNYTGTNYLLGCANGTGYRWAGVEFNNNSTGDGFIGVNNDWALILSAFNTIGSATNPTLIFQDRDGGFNGTTYTYYFNSVGVPVLFSNPTFKNSIREYKKDVLSKFKDINLYWYTYKKDYKFSDEDDETTFINKYLKLKKLEVGFMADELLKFSQKTRIDYIDDDDYIKSVVGKVLYKKRQEQITKAHNILLDQKNNNNGYDYSILYKYNVIATKQLINKVETLESRIAKLEELLLKK